MMRITCVSSAFPWGGGGGGERESSLSWSISSVGRTYSGRTLAYGTVCVSGIYTHNTIRNITILEIKEALQLHTYSTKLYFFLNYFLQLLWLSSKICNTGVPLIYLFLFGVGGVFIFNLLIRNKDPHSPKILKIFPFSGP